MTEADIQADEIETGVETDNERIRTMEHDAKAYADGGEYATVWHLRQLDETTVKSIAFRCEGGLRERVSGAEVFDVKPETSLREFGREHADADPELAVELAREHFSDD